LQQNLPKAAVSNCSKAAPYSIMLTTGAESLFEQFTRSCAGELWLRRRRRMFWVLTLISAGTVLLAFLLRKVKVGAVAATAH
jgi:hypothetical protein